MNTKECEIFRKGLCFVQQVGAKKVYLCPLSNCIYQNGQLLRIEGDPVQCCFSKGRVYEDPSLNIGLETLTYASRRAFVLWEIKDPSRNVINAEDKFPIKSESQF